MFSSITDAWNNNPVTEMSHKLSKGSFAKKSDDTIYKFNDDKSSDPHLSLNTEDFGLSDMFANDKRDRSKLMSISPTPEAQTLRRLLDDDILTINMSDFENSLESSDGVNLTPTPAPHSRKNIGDSRCSFSVKHLSKCDRCYRRLNRLINKKVKEKVNDYFVEANMKKLAAINTQINQNNVLKTTDNEKNSFFSESLKETMIIIIGGVVALVIIYLIVKCLK